MSKKPAPAALAVAPPTTALATDPGSSTEGPVGADDNKCRMMIVVPEETRAKIDEMARVHNCQSSSIVHMAVQYFYEESPFMAIHRRARSKGPGA